MHLAIPTMPIVKNEMWNFSRSQFHAKQVFDTSVRSNRRFRIERLDNDRERKQVELCCFRYDFYRISAIDPHVRGDSVCLSVLFECCRGAPAIASTCGHCARLALDSAPVRCASFVMSQPAPPPPEGSATIPRVRGHWLRAGKRLPRGHRSPLVRLLVSLTSSGALLVIAGVVAAAAIIPPIGARRTARDLASREVQVQLEPGEVVVASTFASQRRWTDMWRESFGILTATDRRLLYVGAPPTPLLRPPDGGPSELLVESYRYDDAFILDPRERIWPFGEGLALRTPAGEVDFLVDAPDRRNARLVTQASTDARREVTRQQQRLEQAAVAAPPPAAVYVPYVVKRGETLTALARRFGTTPDVLRQLNQLQTDAIRAGQRLRVPAVDSARTP